jgi:hypothetical protein
MGNCGAGKRMQEKRSIGLFSGIDFKELEKKAKTLPGAQDDAGDNKAQ